jgi:hypothetical protein
VEDPRPDGTGPIGDAKRRRRVEVAKPRRIAVQSQ